MKRFLLLWILFIVVLTVPVLHAAEAAEPAGQGTARQEILILNSYHPGFAWSDDEQAGIIDLFQAKDKNWLPVIEYLDLKRLPGGRHLTELKQLFRRKYQNQKFSAVIAMDDPALEFATDSQAELFGNAPIVFCGINNYTPSLLKGHPNVTGIAESIDIAETIEVMLRLHPAAREIFVPHDYTVSVLAVRKEIEALVPRFGAKVRFRFSDPLTMKELLKELERLPKDSLVLEIGFVTDKSGRTFGMTEAVMLFFEHSPVPVYSPYEQRLGFGIVGGKLLSARIHGANAARIALRVLAGEKPSAIPVVLESDARFMFDYKVMNRFGIPLSALPEGSTVINKPVSFYANHREVIQTALGIIGILAIVIFLLMVIIIQRRRSTIKLCASDAKYYDLYENAPDMFLSVDAKTATIVECNNTLVNTLGYAREDIIGRSIFEMYHPDCKTDTKRLFQQFTTTGEIRDAELTIRRKDGSIIDVSLNALAVRDKEGKITLSRSFWRDITERKKVENALRESEERLRFHTDNSPMAIVEWNADFVVARWTGAAEKMFGWSFEEAIGKPIMELRMIYEEDLPIVQSVMQRLTDGKSKHVVSSNRNYTKKGEIIHCEWYNSVLHDSAGKMISVMSQVLDITERKQAEEELRLSEENFRLSLVESPLGVCIVTIEGETIYANRAMLNIYGYDSIEELRTTPLKELYTLGSYAEFQIKKERRGKGEYDPFDYEISIVRKNGEVRHLQVFRQEILWNGEKKFQAIYQDITERKRAESEIQSLAKFPSENPNPILRIARDGTLIYVNAAGLSQLPEWHLQAGKGVPSMVRDVVFEALNSGKVRLLELEHCEWVYSFFVAPIADAGYANIYGLDITERKQAEEALRESEKVARQLAQENDLVAEIGRIIGSTLDIDKVYEHFSDKVREIIPFDNVSVNIVNIKNNTRTIRYNSGMPIKDRQIGDVVTLEGSVTERVIHTKASLFINIKDKEELSRQYPGMLHTITSGFQSMMAIPLISKDEVIGTLLLRSVKPDAYTEGDLRLAEKVGSQIAGAIANAQLFLERKRAEEALRESEERYRHIVETSLEGIWVINEEFRTTFVNQRMADMLGYTPEEILGRIVASFLFEEDLEDYAAKVAARRRGVAEIFERRYRRKDGTTLWTIVSSSPLFDSEGLFTSSFSMFTDITYRKQAEETLQASREQMRALAGRLQAVREEERTNIAREIHDELGGALTGLKIDFSMLTRAALKIENQTVRTSLLAGMDSMIKSIDATIQTVRRIAMELRPGVLDDLGLVAALEWQLKDFEKRTGIRCEFFPPVEDISLDADLSTALFRIFQEALTNVARHSGATEVRVRLRADADSSTLEVEDNGKGIEKEKTLSKGSLGLLGMRERAQMFGGRITVTGTPGIGTIVTVEILPVDMRKIDRDQKGDAG